MTTGTVKLHRMLRAAPERVYRAFLDADAMAKWLPPEGFKYLRVTHLKAPCQVQKSTPWRENEIFSSMFTQSSISLPLP